MTKRSPRERAAKKRAERKKRRQSRGGGEGGDAGGGGLMMGMRGGFKKAVHGKEKKSGMRTPGWLFILVLIVALVVIVRRLGLF